MSDNLIGNIFWASFITYAVVFPLTLARSASALRFVSFFGAFCGIYVVVVIVFACLFNREVNPNLAESLTRAGAHIDSSIAGIFNSFPIIIFSFMYQPNLPSIYQEL